MNKIFIDDNYKTQFCDCASLRLLADEVRKRVKGNDVIFIYINFKFEKSKRQDQSGMEFLIWLRLANVMNYCVLHSFETLHSLLNREQKYLIATSKGTSFVQMPIDFDKIELTKKCEEKGEPENIRKALKAVFSNTELKHRLANIYGLWFMFNIHNKFFPKENLEPTIFSKEFLNNFNELQLIVANFLVEGNNSRNSINPLVLKIAEIKKRIKGKNPRILYIDDKAEIGWGSLIKKILFQNETNIDFQVYVPEKRDFTNDANFKILSDKVKDKIYNNGKFTDCILLDLRLADEEGQIDDLSSLSGIMLLEAIHKSFPYLPVIMTTASNKAESIKRVISSGADGLWTKPGLDEIRDEEYYLLSYFELLSDVEQAINKYKTLTEKHIVKAQFELSQTKPFSFLPHEIQDIDIILTDTNVWCETGANLVKNHKVLFLLSSILKREKKRFILIDDVLNELFIHTQNRKDISLRQSASFSIALIQQYKNDFMMESSFGDVGNAIREATNYNLQPSKGGGFHIVSNASKIHSFHNTKEAAEEDLKQRREDAYKPLHADDTFKLLASHLLQQGKNVLFVSNDRKCKIEILNTVKYKNEANNQNWEIPSSFDINKGILKATSKHNSFCMMISTDVLFEICLPKRGTLVETKIVPSPNTP